MRETMQPGKYLCRITSQELTQSKKGNWMVVLRFQPFMFEPRGGGSTEAIEYPQTCTYWGTLSENAKPWVLKDLEALGFAGKISSIHSGDELVGVEAPFLLSYQKQDDGTDFEKWRVFTKRDPKPPVPVSDGDLMKLDAMIGTVGKAAAPEASVTESTEDLDF